MHKSQNGFKHRSIDISNSNQNMSTGITNINPKQSKLQLSTMKKSNKPVIVNRQKPVIRLINQSININNYISNNMTNNIVINNFNEHFTTEGKRRKTHRKTISLLSPSYRKKGDKSLNSSGTFEHSETNRNIPVITGFNKLVKDLTLENSIDNFGANQNDHISSESK